MASTYLSRTGIGTSNNRKKWTFSVWLKKCLNGSEQRIITSSDNSSYDDNIRFESSDQLRIKFNNGTSILTNRLFRDINAWYHIVVKADTAQASANDRLVLYVNGVDERTVGGYATDTMPSQDSNGYINYAQHYIGVTNPTANSNHFNGVMSHIHFTEGYAYTASTFGSTDSVTGEWKINTSPSVSYGTTGFSILKDGITVTDQSPNSNNFTVAAGTLTKTEDCPSNVFATLDALNQEAGANGTTFSNGNTTYSSGGHANVRFYTTNIGANSGKYYCEIKPTSLSSHNLIGISSHGITNAMSDFYFAGSGNVAHTGDEYEYGYKENGNQVNNATSSSYGNTYTTNDIIGIAMDLDNNKLYFSKNGVFQNSGDPTSGSTGTGAISITAPASTDTGFYFFAVAKATSSTDTATFQCNFGNGYFGTTAVSSAGTNASSIGIFEYDVPTGYTALSTKGLNE